MTKNTKRKHNELIRRFKTILRSGKDYSTDYMYAEAAKKLFMTKGTAGNIIRKHYHELITDEMRDFEASVDGIAHDEKVILFSREFRLCERESRLILRYI